jgi:hypothetical protein
VEVEAEQNYAGGRTCKTCSVRDSYYKRRAVELEQERAMLKISKVDLALDEEPALL